MKILVVDDGQLAANSLIRILCRVAPDCMYISALTANDALTWLRQSPVDVAFLNLEMPGMNGLTLARRIQKLQPHCNLVLVTEKPEYALEAMQIFASGFLLKPADDAAVCAVLEHLRYPPENAPADIKLQCFGNFEIFVGGRPLSFKRSKSKELLAYLVDRNGATCTNGEMLAVLWEDKPDTASLHSHLRNLIFDLSHTLEDAGARGLLVRGRSTLALDTTKVDCDYYNFLQGDEAAISAYHGEYMTQFSWAEITRSALRQHTASPPEKLGGGVAIGCRRYLKGKRGAAAQRLCSGLFAGMNGKGQKKRDSVKLYTFLRNNCKCLLNNYLSHILAIHTVFVYNSRCTGAKPRL